MRMIDLLGVRKLVCVLLMATNIASLHGAGQVINNLYQDIQQKIAPGNIVTIKSLLQESAGNELNSASKIMPSSINKFLDEPLQNVRLSNTAPMVRINRAGLTFSATTTINKVPVELITYCIDDYGVLGLIFEIRSKGAFTFATIDKKLEKFDLLDAVGLRLIIATSTYVDAESSVRIPALSVSGIGTVSIAHKLLANVRTFVERLNPAFIVGDLNKIIGVASIDLFLEKSKLALSLPLRIGIDFEALSAQGKLKLPPSVIKRIELTNLRAILLPVTTSISGGATLDVYLTTQVEPLTLSGSLTFSPTTVIAFAGMQGAYTSAFGLSWLTLNEVGVEVIFGLATPLMLAAGIPLVGAGIQGAFDIGSSNDKTDVRLAAKVALPSNVVGAAAEEIKAIAKEGSILAAVTNLGPEIGLFGTVNQLDLSQICSLLVSMAAAQNKQIPWLDDVPTLLFTDLEMRVMSKSMTIAGEEFKQGVQFKGACEIAHMKGNIDIQLVTQPMPSLAAVGQLTPLDTKFLRLVSASGTGGPRLNIKAGILTGLNLLIDGKVEIPMLGISQAVFMGMDENNNFAVSIESSAPGHLWETDFDLVIPTKTAEDLAVSYEVRISGVGDFADFIMDALKDALPDSWWSSWISKIVRKATDLADLKINSCRGRISGKELMQGKMPAVTIDLTLTVLGKESRHVLNNVQFDFKNPVTSARNIAKALVNFI